MAENVRIVFLGGLGEIGRNCAVIEHSGRLIVLDCGVMFPDPEMPGVDLVLPDFSYLRENAGRVDGIILTHGHEDHTGGLGFLLREIQAPVFGSALTLGLARSRVDDAGLGSRAQLITVTDGERRKIGPFDVEFIPVTHSVPHGFATAFHTPQGVILHSGDFKLDMTPVDDRRTDLARIGAPTRPTQRSRVIRAPSGASARRCGRSSARRPAAASSWPASQATCTASSSSRTRRSRTTARSRCSAGRCCAMSASRESSACSRSRRRR
jgi:ribonuclease J